MAGSIIVPGDRTDAICRGSASEQAVQPDATSSVLCWE